MERNNVMFSLARFENAMCIYRNCSYLNKRTKYFVKLRILIELCFVSLTYGHYVRHVFELYQKDKEHNSAKEVLVQFYMFFMAVNSLVAIFLSYYNSNHFREFVSNIEAVYELYENDTTFREIKRKQYRSCFIDMTIFTASYVLIVAFYVITSNIFKNYVVVFEFVFELSLELRYYYENLVFYDFIKVIVAPLEFLNASVGEVVGKLGKMKSERGEEYDDQLQEVQQELRKWGAASRHLVTASYRLCDSFGVQIALSIFSATFYNITFLYLSTSYIVDQKAPSLGVDLINLAYSLISFVVIKVLIVSKGQRAIRNGEQLHKNLIILHNVLLRIPGEKASACARAAAGLARRLRAAPLRLRLLPALAVQMALLAEILAVIANYTIVLLQFNHVV